MVDKVDLKVVGTIGNVSRSDLEQKLVDEFGQEPAAFQELLDAAFGDIADYSAQSDVDQTTAQAGKDQLEKLGIECVIKSPGAEDISVAPASDGSDSIEVGEVDGPTDFSDELGAASGAASLAAAGVAAGAVAGLAKGDVLDATDAAAEDFSDLSFDEDLDADGSDTIDVSDAAADDLSDLSFDEDLDTADSIATDTSLDAASEELSDLSFDEDLDATDAKTTSADSADNTKAKAKSDVPDALAAASIDELDAELIDPAPVVKEKSAPVELDDGGLSLTDDPAPLTKPKAKANPDAADDGGLTMADDSLSDTVSKGPLEADKEVEKPEPVVDFDALDDDDAADDKPTDKKSDDLKAEGVTTDDIAADLTEDTKAADLNEASDPSLDFEELATEEVQSAKIEEKELPDTTAEAAIAETADETSSNDLFFENDDAEDELATAADASQDAADIKIPDAPAEIQAESADLPAADIPAANEPVHAVTAAEPTPSPVTESNAASTSAQANLGGLVLPGQPGGSVVPQVTAEEDLEDVKSNAKLDEVEVPASANVAESKPVAAKKPVAQKSAKVKKMAAAVAGIAVLVGGGTYAFKNAGSIMSADSNDILVENSGVVQDVQGVVNQVKLQTADINASSDLESISTEQLLVSLSKSSNANTITDLEPYFLESVNRNRSGPRLGAAVPAESDSMSGVKNRVPHPADKFFDDWANREADLSLFLALLDSLIGKGDLDVAQQLSDRAKDKLFAVMSSQRLARAYSDAGENDSVARLMKLAARDTYAIKSAEERVIAMSDYALTEQTIGLNEDARDTFLKASILSRNLRSPELVTVGLSSSAYYFQKAGRTKEANEMLSDAMEAAKQLPKNSAAHDLAIRYIALSESRMGMFNQALKHTKLITDPSAAVSAYHGIALAIESAGDETNARRVLNMAYRAGSKIVDPDERSQFLSKVVLASETE